VLAEIAEVQQSMAAAIEEQTEATNLVSDALHGAAAGTAEIAKSIGTLAEGAAATTESAGLATTSADELAELAGALSTFVGGAPASESQRREQPTPRSDARPSLDRSARREARVPVRTARP
jgi:hypothetical protein